MKKLISVFTFLGLVTSAFGQIDSARLDTIAKPDNPFGLKVEPLVKKQMLARDWDQFAAWRNLDSLSDTFHQFSPLYLNNSISKDLGNLGSPFQSLSFQKRGVFGRRLSLMVLEPYILKAEDIQIYNTFSPFTEFNYTSGQFFGLDNAEHLIHLRHSQNFNPNWNLGFEFNRLAFGGNYQNQRNSHSSSALSIAYFPTEKSYGFTFGAFLNKMDLEQNGGTTQDTFFGVDRFNRRAEVDVHLDKARHQILDRGIQVQQRYKMGASLDGPIARDSLNAFFLIQNLSYGFRSFAFRDEGLDTSFYDTAFLTNLDSTRDLLAYETYAGDFGIEQFINRGPLHLSYLGLLGLEKNVLRNCGNDSSFWDAFVEGEMEGHWERGRKGKIEFGGRTKWFVNEGLIGAGFLELRAGIHNPRFRLGASASLQRRIADLMETRYLSNHGQWQNTFEHQSYLAGQLNLQYRPSKTGIRIKTTRASKVVYWLENLGPQQSLNDFNLIEVGLSQIFSAGAWHLKNSITYQMIDEDAAFDLPQWIYEGDAYFRKDVFNSALVMQAGLNIHWHSTFESPRFIVPFSRFTDKRKTLESYPLMDVYFSFELQELRFFLKMEHLNQDLLFPAGYFNFPNYPAADRNFKLGLSWRFWL